MESWRTVWREGFQPLYTTPELERLREALTTDSPRLTQGSTCTPPPLMILGHFPVEACCAVSLPAVKEWGVTTVGDVEGFFAKKCNDADERLGEVADCAPFLNAFDTLPRPEIVRELLAEVERELSIRELELELQPEGH